VWLGPQNAWRWPFDATFGEWGVGIAAFLVCFVVFWLVLPLGGFLILLSLVTTRWFSKRMRGHRDWSRAYFSAALLFWLLLFPSFSFWLLPMSWWLAPMASIVLSALIVRWARPYLDANRTVRHWLRTWQRVATGPRPRRKPVAIVVPTLDIASNDDPDDDLARFMLAVVETDMEEVPVATYVHVVEVEAMLWAPRQSRARTSTDVIAWLRSREVPHTIGKVKYKSNGNGTEMLVDAELVVVDIPVENDRVIILDLASRKVTTSERRQFAETYRPTGEVPA